MAEDTAYIRVVAGSIPARPIRLKKKWLIFNQPNHMHVWSSGFGHLPSKQVITRVRIPSHALYALEDKQQSRHPVTVEIAGSAPVWGVLML